MGGALSLPLPLSCGQTSRFLDGGALSLPLSHGQTSRFLDGGCTYFFPVGRLAGVWMEGALSLPLSHGQTGRFLDGRCTLLALTSFLWAD